MSILTIKNSQPTISSEIIANELGILHRATLQLIKKHQSKIELFGRVAFEMLPFETNGGTQEKQICYLNENQAIFVGTLSKNTEKAVQYKAVLTQAFSNYKNQIQITTPKEFSLDHLLEQNQNWLFKLSQKVETLELEVETKDNTISSLTPKADFVDNVLVKGNTGLTAMSIVAKEVGLGSVRLYKILRDEKIWFWALNEHGVNENNVKQDYIDNGSFVVKAFYSERDKRTYDKIFATNKGKLLCYKTVKESQNAPKFEIKLIENSQK